MSTTVGIVIPALDPDLDRLATYIEEVRAAVKPEQIRVELDEPRHAHEVVRERLPATISISPHRRGKGLAITAGFEALETDVLAFVDADGSTAPESLGHLVETVATGGGDIAVGTRHHPDAEVSRVHSSLRGFMSRGFVGFARVVTGIELSDFQCGAKAISRDAWEAVRPTLGQTGFGWDLEFLWTATRRGIVIVERPIQWEDRPGSTVPPFRTMLELAWLVGRIFAADRTGTAADLGDSPTLLERLQATEER